MYFLFFLNQPSMLGHTCNPSAGVAVMTVGARAEKGETGGSLSVLASQSSGIDGAQVH